MKTETTHTHTHTKGPWRVIEHGKGREKHCVGTSNVAPVQAIICEINTKSVGTNDKIRLANANLIAAAPDMLVALREIALLAAEINRSHAADVITVKARVAISKVEGNA